MRSSSTPPNIMAPRRPLPMGEDEVKSAAGASNQMVVSGVPAVVPACKSEVADESPATRIRLVTRRNVFFIFEQGRTILVLLQAQDESTVRGQDVLPFIGGGQRCGSNL